MKKLTIKQQIIKTLTTYGIFYPKNSTTKQLKTIIKNAITDINRSINQHERHKNSFYWKPYGGANQRRQTENRESFKVTIGNLKYVSDVQCSCKNYYYTGSFYNNGVKKNITCFKKLLKELNNYLIST